jgi:hypothetical protein
VHSAEAALAQKHGDGHFFALAAVTSGARAGSFYIKVIRPQHIRGFFEVFGEVFFEEAAFAGGDDVYAQFVYLRRVIPAQTVPARGRVGAGDGEIRLFFFFYIGKALFQGVNPRFADDFGNVEDPHSLQNCPSARSNSAAAR